MASLKTHTNLLFWIVSCVIADKAFVNLECRSENHGVYRQQSVLECIVRNSEEVTDAKIVDITWRKIGVEHPLLAYRDGQPPNTTQHNSGIQFAEPDWNEKNMNVSLLLTNTGMADAGGYRCLVSTDSGHATCSTHLSVTAKYNTPELDIHMDSDTTLLCNSSGGFPEGQISWFDGHGSDCTSSSVLVAKPMDDGLFNLSSKLVLPPGSAVSKYRCSVHSAAGGQDGEATFQTIGSDRISGTVPPDTASTVVPTVLIGLIIIAVLGVFLFLRRRSQRDHQAVVTNGPYVEEGGGLMEGAEAI